MRGDEPLPSPASGSTAMRGQSSSSIKAPGADSRELTESSPLVETGLGRRSKANTSTSTNTNASGKGKTSHAPSLPAAADQRRNCREATAYSPIETDDEKSDSSSISKVPWLKHGGAYGRLDSYVLLVALYFLQGVPLGLIFGTMPYLLKSRSASNFSYTDLGLFSLAGYPYSLKLLWSPIVDSYYFARIGRRKTWIVPMQLLIGASFLFIGFSIDSWILDADANISVMTTIFTLLVLFCATQDIAVDGWALTLLDPELVHYSSTCQTIGLNTGYFVSFTVFLALNSTDFWYHQLHLAATYSSNTYLRTTPFDVGIVEIAPFLKFWGVASITATIFVAFLKKEDSPAAMVSTSIYSAYATIFRILSLPNVRRLAVALLLAKIGFIALDSIAPLKLLEKGFPRADLALTVLIDFPFQILLGFLAASWSKGKRPLLAWQYALYFKFAMAAVSMLVLKIYPSDGAIGRIYFLFVITMTIFSSFASTILFVSMGSFFSIISDPLVGGTYLTLLNTLANLGGTWPKLMVMSAVDWFTWRQCVSPADKVFASSTALDCYGEAAVQTCKSLGGYCATKVDGFYIVNSFCVVLGLALSLRVLAPLVRKLELIPRKEWLVSMFISSTV